MMNRNKYILVNNIHKILDQSRKCYGSNRPQNNTVLLYRNLQTKFIIHDQMMHSSDMMYFVIISLYQSSSMPSSIQSTNKKVRE